MPNLDPEALYLNLLIYCRNEDLPDPEEFTIRLDILKTTGKCGIRRSTVKWFSTTCLRVSCTETKTQPPPFCQLLCIQYGSSRRAGPPGGVFDQEIPGGRTSDKERSLEGSPSRST